jgi:uncharacterized membrane protein
MEYKYLMYSHLVNVVPYFFYSAYLLSFKKGTPFHKLLGKIFISLIIITAKITLSMPTDVGLQFFNH